MPAEQDKIEVDARFIEQEHPPLKVGGNYFSRKHGPRTILAELQPGPQCFGLASTA